MKLAPSFRRTGNRTAARTRRGKAEKLTSGSPAPSRTLSTGTSGAKPQLGAAGNPPGSGSSPVSGSRKSQLLYAKGAEATGLEPALPPAGRPHLTQGQPDPSDEAGLPANQRGEAPAGGCPKSASLPFPSGFWQQSCLWLSVKWFRSVRMQVGDPMGPASCASMTYEQSSWLLLVIFSFSEFLEFF